MGGLVRGVRNNATPKGPGESWMHVQERLFSRTPEGPIGIDGGEQKKSRGGGKNEETLDVGRKSDIETKLIVAVNIKTRRERKQTLWRECGNRG